jgi:type I restriction enzyme S subunit
MITGAYTVMECNDREMAKFIELFYIAMDDRKLLSPLYSGLRNTIPKDRFLGAKFPVPPIAERAEILATVKQKTSSLDKSISNLESEIELLKEYRTSLVTDVVTGKIDVNEAAKNLPEIVLDESDEQEISLEDEEAEELLNEES